MKAVKAVATALISVEVELVLASAVLRVASSTTLLDAESK